MRSTSASRSWATRIAVVLLLGITSASPGLERPRVVVLTDIAGDPDDQQSLVRFLLYTNHFDVEGLIATTSCWKPSHPDVGTIHKLLDSYEKVHPNLLLHAEGYPLPDQLRDATKSGIDGYGMAAALEQLDNEAVQHVISVVDRADPRPVWFVVWGGGNTLGAAVAKVAQERSPAEAEAFVAKIRGYEIAIQDDAFPYIAKRFPAAKLISAALLWKGISATRPEIEAWQESRGGNNSVFNAAWIREHVQAGHGPLGDQYPNPTFLYEGDTPSYLYLIPNGLNYPENVHFGGWGGRFEASRKWNVPSGTGFAGIESTLDQHRDYALFSDAIDSWNFGPESYDNVYCTVFRWREAFQSDFAARMDWCTQPYDNANHPPVAVIAGDTTKDLLQVTAAPDSELTLDASASFDPDGNALRFQWWIYEECGTFSGKIHIEQESDPVLRLRIPQDGADKTFHLILTLTDNGIPELTSYRRIIVTMAQQEGRLQ